MQVVATTGAKQVQVGYDGDRQRVSLAVFQNAAGGSILPVVLLKGSNNTRGLQAKKEMMSGWPEPVYMLTEAATQTEDTWRACAEYFCNKVGSGNILILDGHSSRVSLEAVDSFLRTGNELFTLHAHSSHFTQPFDIAVAKPLRDAVAKFVDEMRLGTLKKPGVAVTQRNIMIAIKRAYFQVMAPKFDAAGNSINIPSKGFAKAGLYPWNPKITEEDMFGPYEYFKSTVLDKKAKPNAPTSAERLELVSKHTVAVLESGSLQKELQKAMKAKRAPAVPGATLLTGAEHILKVTAAVLEKSEKIAAVAARKEARAVGKKRKFEASAAALGSSSAEPVPKKRKGSRKPRSVSAVFVPWRERVGVTSVVKK